MRYQPVMILKKFKGVTYHSYMSFSSKSKAKNAADKLRQKGCPARVIKVGEEYVVMIQ